MKVVKKILSVIGAILASFLTPILVCLLIAAPFINMVASFTAPDFIPELISKVDVASLLESNAELKESLEKSDVKTEDIETFLKTDAIGDITKLYYEDLTEVALGNREESKFTAEAVREILVDNMDELVDQIKDIAPDTKGKADAEIEADILSQFDKNGEEFIAMLPKAEEIQEMVSDFSGGADIGAVFVFIRDVLMTVIFAVIALLAGLIFVFRLPKFKGFMWDGIIFTLAGLLVLAMSSGLEGAIAALQGSGFADIADMLAPFASSLSGAFTPFAITYTVIGVVCIAAFIVLFVIRKSRRKKLAMAAATAASAPTYVPAYTPVSQSDAAVEPSPETAATEAPAEPPHETEEARADVEQEQASEEVTLSDEPAPAEQAPAEDAPVESAEATADQASVESAEAVKKDTADVG